MTVFQYGKVNWFSEPTFVLGISRQLEVIDSAGEHESYVQVQFELRYPLGDDLDSVGGHSEWWFPGGGVSFGSWLDSVDRAEISNRLAVKTPREFAIQQEMV
ncbi:hypothetical protein [Streptomyces sp. TR06-5]|uniref:hypothetical protein n=1 Tax=unclassified Streptomyces TaxID=2593676 RepID=UPI0039A3CD25